MFRPASRTILRHHASATQQLRIAHARRFVNTSAQPGKPRSWKATVMRWSLAIGAVYYYNTSSVFAEDPARALQNASSKSNESAPLPTIESVSAARKQRNAALTASRKPEPEPKPRSEPADESGAGKKTDAAAAADVEVAPTESQSVEMSPGELEAEAGQEGAFNPETGEINWDCPCLGGMAHGPCGEEFREAFSCFVYSTEEPKGMECIDKFKGMQDCFRLHPDVYGSELDEDDVDERLQEHMASGEADAAIAATEATETSAAGTPVDVEAGHAAISKESDRQQVKREIQEDLEEADTLQAPQERHDATHANVEAEAEQKKEKNKQQ